ncbi:MAG TPA: ABC transporter ATP-binding protein [Sandaracinaceae bacterium LLY-WYZ-13_1]|nr:ABC transporter ATP-binding protein [Sandaracinaceae bacterium LLY-WYZ-13_1]
MIELHDVTKAYRTKAGEHVVLDRLSCTFEDRVSVGILGVNGAGKSTLLRILGGAEQPDAGQIVRHGRVSWPIGFAGGFNSSLSGEENCRFAARIYGADIDEVVEFARGFAEVGHYFHMPVRTYSSGMRARLAFGLSMAIDFDTYLVDEVTAVGDARFQAKCKEAFAERRERSTVIIVSHQLRTIRQYADRYALLRRGKLHFFDDIDEVARIYKAAA